MTAQLDESRDGITSDGDTAMQAADNSAALRELIEAARQLPAQDLATLLSMTTILLKMRHLERH